MSFEQRLPPSLVLGSAVVFCNGVLHWLQGLHGRLSAQPGLVKELLYDVAAVMRATRADWLLVPNIV